MSRQMAAAATIAASILTLACGDGLFGQQFGMPEPTLETVSIVSLIASPRSYVGRRLRIMGPGYFSEEGDGVCLSRSDIEGRVPINCISIVLDLERLKASRSSFQRSEEVFVIVEGTFDPEYRGLYGATSGSIDDVTRVYVYTREEPTQVGSKE